jgi:hypothetical protein
MPEGTTLEEHLRLLKKSQRLSTKPQVVNYQNYIGHRPQSLLTDWYVIMICVAEVMADIQVNLLQKIRQSHDIAKDVRPQVQKIAKIWHKCEIVEVPQDLLYQH